MQLHNKPIFIQPRGGGSLNKYNFFSDESIVTWDTNPVDFELKEGAKPVCSRVYQRAESARNYA